MLLLLSVNFSWHLSLRRRLLSVHIRSSLRNETSGSVESREHQAFVSSVRSRMVMKICTIPGMPVANPAVIARASWWLMYFLLGPP